MISNLRKNIEKQKALISNLRKNIENQRLLFVFFIRTLKKCGMAVRKSGKDLFHDSLAEKDGFRMHIEFGTVLFNGRQFPVIQIDDLSVPADKGCPVPLDEFRIYS